VTDGHHDKAQSTISIEEYDIDRDGYMDMVDDLIIVHEHESFTDEFTWKYGYKSKDVHDCYLDSDLINMMTYFVTVFKIITSFATLSR